MKIPKHQTILRDLQQIKCRPGDVILLRSRKPIEGDLAAVVQATLNEFAKESNIKLIFLPDSVDVFVARADDQEVSHV